MQDRISGVSWVPEGISRRGSGTAGFRILALIVSSLFLASCYATSSCSSGIITCTCANGRIETFSPNDNERFQEARNDPKSCCYYQKYVNLARSIFKPIISPRSLPVEAQELKESQIRQIEGITEIPTVKSTGQNYGGGVVQGVDEPDARLVIAYFIRDVFLSLPLLGLPT